MRIPQRAWSVGVALAMVGAGCETEPEPASCLRSRVGDTIQISNVDEVDLLLMIDGSGSMAEEQSSMMGEIPRIIRILTSGDRDEDGVVDPEDFAPARSLHVGIVSSDMGTGTVSGIANCDPGLGDDGILRNTSTAAGCSASYPAAVFDFTTGVDDVTTFSQDVACVASLGTGGCGFGQQLDAALKAVSISPSSPVTWTRPDYVPPTFLDGTFGHGGVGGFNDGFLRPNSVLAIILVTDEEDCSTPDPSIFDPEDPDRASVDLNLRCHTFASELYPIQRYVDGLLGLRPQSSALVFGAIAGVPLEATEADPPLAYQQMLDLPAMQETIDPVSRNQLVPSCTAPLGRGVAFPPRRIVQVAQGLEALGASTTVQSICNGGFSSAVDVILEKIAGGLSSACLPRSLSPDADPPGARCNLLFLLPEIGGSGDIQHCADLPSPEAFTRQGVEEVSAGGRTIRRELCRVAYVGVEGAGTVPGWFIDDGDPRLGSLSMLPRGCARRIAFSMVQLPSTAEVRIECWRTIYEGTDAPVQFGHACEPGTGADGSGLVVYGAERGPACSMGFTSVSHPESTLWCDAFDETCGLQCRTDTDCTGAGLRGWICDHRTPEETFGPEIPSALLPIHDRPHDFCVNPTCEALDVGRGPAI